MGCEQQERYPRETTEGSVLMIVATETTEEASRILGLSASILTTLVAVVVEEGLTSEEEEEDDSRRPLGEG